VFAPDCRGAPPAKRQKSTITVGDVTEKNINQVKVMNSVIFPVPYGAKFYQSVLQKPDLCQIGS
jgi:hypothetical protein